MTRKETFYKTRHDKYRNGSHNYFQSPLGSPPERSGARISTRKQPAISKCQSGSTCHNDRPYLKRTVQPDGQHRFGQQSLSVKESLKSPYHDSIRKQHIPCSETGQQSHRKAIERYHDIIQRNAQEHRHLLRTVIYRHRFTVSYIFKCHIHIAIAQNQPDKVRIIPSRNDTYHNTGSENEKRYQQFLTGIMHRLRHFLRPESNNPSPLFALIAINHIVQCKSQIVEINGDTGRRIMGLCKS